MGASVALQREPWQRSTFKLTTVGKEHTPEAMRAVCIVVMAAATLVSAAATPPPPVCPPTGDAATTATTEPVYEWTSIAFDFPGGQPSGDSYQPPLCVPSGGCARLQLPCSGGIWLG